MTSEGWCIDAYTTRPLAPPIYNLDLDILISNIRSPFGADSVTDSDADLWNRTSSGRKRREWMCTRSSGLARVFLRFPVLGGEN